MKEWRDCWPGGLREEEYSTLNLMAHCREGGLGYNYAKCRDCEHVEWYGSSCGNRHCPKCLGPRQAKWAERTCGRLPDCPHFHVVFTVAPEFEEFYERNYRLATEVFFGAAAETLKAFQSNNWGVEGGFFGVLHTWGSALNWHPHLHVLVSAGGRDAVSGRWRRTPSRYLFPVRSMSKVFRAIVLRRLEELDGDEGVDWPGGLEEAGPRRRWREQMSRRNWNIFSRPTLGNTRAVVRYLARYTSRIALSNQRIVGVDAAARKVSFKWRDYRDGGRVKEMTLGGGEFLRRFARHLVPKGVRRIRSYGLLAGKVDRWAQLPGAPTGRIAENAAQPAPRECPRCRSTDREAGGRFGTPAAAAQGDGEMGLSHVTCCPPKTERYSLLRSLRRYLAARDGPETPGATSA